MRIPEYPESKEQKVQAEEGFYPGRWWQALDSDGKLLAETSDRDDFKKLNIIGQPGVTIRRLYERTEKKWVEDNPFPEESI